MKIADRQIKLILNGDMLHGMRLCLTEPVFIKTRLPPEPPDLWFSARGTLRDYDPILDNSMAIVVELEPRFFTNKPPGCKMEHGIAVGGTMQSANDKIGCFRPCTVEDWLLGMPFIQQLIAGQDLEIGTMFKTEGFLHGRE